MKFSSNVSKAIVAVSTLATAAIVVSGGSASAQSIGPATVTPTDNANVVVVNTSQKGFGGAYVGGGVAAGVTNGGQQEDAALLGGNIQGRIQIPNTPVSARAAILFGPHNTAIMPMVSYDVPIARNTNAYVGAGYSFVERDGRNTPLGNQSAPVVTLGAESSVTRDVVVYGDAKWGINAYKNSTADALSFQAGVGYRF